MGFFGFSFVCLFVCFFVCPFVYILFVIHIVCLYSLCNTFLCFKIVGVTIKARGVVYS